MNHRTRGRRLSDSRAKAWTQEIVHVAVNGMSCCVFEVPAMKIAASSIELQSSRQFTQSFEMNERLDVWRDGVDTSGAGRARVQISDAARMAQQAEASARQSQSAAETQLDETIDDDPRLSVLVRMIEFLTGEPVRRFSMRDLQAAEQANISDAGSDANEASGTRRLGFGMEYEASATYSESERTSFSAAGVVRTADGQQIRFELGFTLSRSYTESASVSMRAGDTRVKDPLVLDFGGAAAALSDAHFEFDLNGDGTKEELPMIGGSGFLAFDRNDNGRIDDGRELFGPASGDGFAELAALDDDGNGWIDEADAAWSQLRVWQPDADGKGRVQSLNDAGVGAFYLGRVDTPFSINSAANETLGMMRASSIYVREDGSAGTVSQVDLAV